MPRRVPEGSCSCEDTRGGILDKELGAPYGVSAALPDPL